MPAFSAGLPEVRVRCRETYRYFAGLNVTDVDPNDAADLLLRGVVVDEQQVLPFHDRNRYQEQPAISISAYRLRSLIKGILASRPAIHREFDVQFHPGSNATHR